MFVSLWLKDSNDIEDVDDSHAMAGHKLFSFHFCLFCNSILFSLSPEDVGLLGSSESKTIINTKRKNWNFVFKI